ncbi:alpha/beta fold hydrolase [Nocardia sp. 2]|uniref:Alpha/beta fold hydrolase n=1 Tax=Nocardia acididurans TaxID=2802282 RepID=A0ABS1M9K1_9NOCA|nr:alpha/beta fold hydrolase [Nocardia acididurans]MBL1076894.1 alpha/beta fold hydrolase [Nocardia acididurans]
MVTWTSNGIHANVAIADSGPAIVLLHGFPHTWRLWSEIIGPLSAHYRVIAPDLRGFGATTRAPDSYDAATLAADTGLRVVIVHCFLNTDSDVLFRVWTPYCTGTRWLASVMPCRIRRVRRFC